MSFKLDRKELKIIFWIVTSLLIWFMFIIPYVSTFVESNLFLTYSLFIAIYSFLTLKFVFKINPFDKIRLFFAWGIVWFTADLTMPPLLIARDTITTLPLQAQFSSDYLLYKLIEPLSLQPPLPYYFIYVLAPTVLLVIAAWLLQEGRFQEFLRKAL